METNLFCAQNKQKYDTRWWYTVHWTFYTVFKTYSSWNMGYV